MKGRSCGWLNVPDGVVRKSRAPLRLRSASTFTDLKLRDPLRCPAAPLPARRPPGVCVRWSGLRGFRFSLHAACGLELMDEGQWQSEGPVRRGGTGEAELQSEGSARSPDQNHNRLLEEGEEVEQGPRGGHRTTQDSTNNNNSTGEDEEEEEDDEDEAYEEGSKVEEEDDEEMDSNSGAFSPEPDGQIQDSPSPSPSPTVSEAPLSVECTAVGAAVPELGPSLSACVCVLEERGDDALLPHTLHQIAEALVLERDYQRAIRFLQLERLYHERVLSNIAALQDQWESRWRLVGQGQSSSVSDSDLDIEHLETLRHICRTHTQPRRSAERCELVVKVQRNRVISESAGENHSASERLCGSAETEKLMDEQKRRDDFSEERHRSPASQQGETDSHFPDSSLSPSSSSDPATPSFTVTDSPRLSGGGEEEAESPADTHTVAKVTDALRTGGPGKEMEGGGEPLDTGQDLGPDRTEVAEPVEKGGGEEEVEEAVEALELEAGGEHQEPLDLEVPELRAEDELEEEGHGVETLEVEKTDTLDDLAKRIQVEEITPAAGLVSILKRRASLEGTSSTTPTPKPASKRKVRFRVPDDGLDNEEVGGDPWLLLLLLCLATVVISVGGTALYCTFGDAQSSVCTDFSHNMDFYVGQVQRGVDELRHWLTRGS
ncbi:consortin [Colossoma macropomum]|uniref:consortin n=1 Tax=Colossoma macropomum TaxID=42526 RepID=UPI0018656034|nr:consortin [Colossoma macropomum]